MTSDDLPAGLIAVLISRTELTAEMNRALLGEQVSHEIELVLVGGRDVVDGQVVVVQVELLALVALQLLEEERH